MEKIKSIFTNDKLHHMVYSYAICMTLCIISGPLGSMGTIISGVITFCIGIGKEVADHFDKNELSRAELRDLMADALGVILAMAVWDILVLPNVNAI